MAIPILIAGAAVAAAAGAAWAVSESTSSSGSSSTSASSARRQVDRENEKAEKSERQKQWLAYAKRVRTNLANGYGVADREELLLLLARAELTGSPTTADMLPSMLLKAGGRAACKVSAELSKSHCTSLLKTSQSYRKMQKEHTAVKKEAKSLRRALELLEEVEGDV